MSDFFSTAHPASTFGNRPSQDVNLSMTAFNAARANLERVDNTPHRVVMHPKMYELWEEMERLTMWLEHLLRTSHRSFNEQYPDRRWSKRTRQRRYVRWCESKAKMAAKMGLQI
jgi:hypothetical protein